MVADQCKGHGPSLVEGLKKSRIPGIRQTPFGSLNPRFLESPSVSRVSRLTLAVRGLLLRAMKRISWDEYFLKIAGLVAERSTCLRRRVGAVLVREKRILATGYNGVPHGVKHCDEVGCAREQMKLKPSTHIELCRGIHAEQNAIVQAATSGVNISGAILYCTHQPCITCTKILINAGIREFRVTEPYPDAFAAKMLKEAGVKVQVVNRRPKRRV